MVEFLQTPASRAVLLTAALAALIAVGAYLIGKARALRRVESPGTSELLSDFRDLHDKGELTDEEFRTIKGVLTQRLEREWMGNGERG
jgi:hypothetical protein